MKFKNVHTGTRWKMPNGKVFEVLEKLPGDRVKIGILGNLGTIETVLEIDGTLDYNATRVGQAKGEKSGTPASLVYEELRRGGTVSELIERVRKVRPTLEYYYTQQLVKACLHELRVKGRLHAILLPDGSVFYRIRG